MCAFIVNPPIRDDADYYRRDDRAIEEILGGASKLVVGLRRSGKTSFLYRVQRTARARGLPCQYFELADVGEPELEALEASPPDVLLLDEAEVWHEWDRALLDRLLRVIRRSRVVAISCAPQFILELDQEPASVQRFIDKLDRHVIGPLSDAEARDLLAHTKRPPGPLTDRQVTAVLDTSERLAIVVQAVGAQSAGMVDAVVSLGGFGKRILTGLTDAARRILVDAAYEQPAPEGPEADILIATGALRRGAGGQTEIASSLLAELIRAATPRISPVAVAVRGPEPPKWERHARLLHLSDLHFGSHAIDPPKAQATRLIQALERDDRIPDFIVISGDLSWSGHRRELRDAEVFLELLVAWLVRRRGWDELECRRRFIIVPGNHEAAWALSNGIPGGAGAPSEEEIEHWARYSLGPFANFANRFYRKTLFWDLDTPCLAVTFTDPSIAFVAMSTAHYITQATRDAKFGHHLLEAAVELLSHEDVQRARFRVGVWHHNLRPFQSQAGAITDVDLAVRGFLRSKPSLDLALHGHVHQGEVEVFLPRGGGQVVLPYSAVGSFGVVASHRPGDDIRGRVHNELALVELSTSGAGRRMQTEFYELKPDPDLIWQWVRARTEEPRPL
ncbi:MAG TPA: metallophosphoesterase [Kofleriaceae bacterium]|nr:metallophosphoesterase [Kofleriaceae bacterium]